jgi:hypothetical protein
VSSAPVPVALPVDAPFVAGRRTRTALIGSGFIADVQLQVLR